MPKAYRTESSKWTAAIQEAKKTYFLDVLAPYIKEGVLDTKTLHEDKPKLYEEFRLSFKGIRTGCTVLGIHPSAAALRAKVGPVRKQIRTLALAYIQEHGLEGAANKLGVGVEQVEKVQENLVTPQAFRGGRKKSPGRPKKKK